MAQTLRTHLNARLSDLNTEFESSWKAHLQDLCDYVSPRSARFLATDRNKGDKRNQKILNEAATFSIETAQRGMMSGITNPAMPWLRVKTPFPELNKVQSVRLWLDTVADRILEVFLRSNLYTELPNIYEDLLVYGTSACAVEKDRETVIRLQAFPVGSYRLAMDGTGRINACYREFQMTRRELVDKFGIDNCSDEVRVAIEQDSGAEQQVNVVHVVEPNPNFIEGSPFAKRMRFRSVYYEKSADENKYLRQSGFNTFRILAPRWKVKGGDTYGESPLMQVLGSVKMLQKLENKALTLLEKVVSPPLTAPTTLKNKAINQLPGGLTLYDATAGGAEVKPMFQISGAPLEAAEAKIQNVINRIRRALFEDVFLMLAQDTRSNVTAEEIRERIKEKIQTLGPILLRLNDELLDPLIEITFEIMSDPDFAGLIPEAPEELAGAPLNIEYVSEMAKAMKLSGLGAIEQTVGYIMNIAAQQASMNTEPTALDKLNIDEIADAYADLAGTPAKIINDLERVTMIRDARAQAQAEMAAQAEAQQQAAMVKDLAQAPADTDSVLSRMGGEE